MISTQTCVFHIFSIVVVHTQPDISKRECGKLTYCPNGKR